MKSFELEIKLLEINTKWRSWFYIDNEEKIKKDQKWHLNYSYEEAYGVLEIKHYGELYLGQEDYRYYPIKEIKKFSSESILDIIEQGCGFEILLDDEDDIPNLHFEPTYDNNYMVYVSRSYKYWEGNTEQVVDSPQKKHYYCSTARCTRRNS
jgi:hypothetical protein